MKRASINRARSLCLGILLATLVASGLGVGSKGEASATHPDAAPATLEAPMTATGQPEIYFVPKVVEQFNALSLRPDGLAFGIGGSPNPSLNKHYQGIVRKPGSGTPYLFVSRSGNDTPTCGGCGDDVANLLIVRMGSRDTNGERLRTNRLIRDWVPHVRDSDGQPVLDSGGNPVPWTKPPDPRDTTVAHISNDIDLYLEDPSSMLNFDGATWNSPESVVVNNPTPGTWRVMVDGYEVNTLTDEFELRVTLDGQVVR